MKIKVVLLKCANFGMVPGREPCIEKPEEAVRVEIPLSEEQERSIISCMRNLANVTRFEHGHLSFILTVDGIQILGVKDAITSRTARDFVKNAGTVDICGNSEL